jgi:multidrug efflux pump subunit AcrB
MTETGAPEPPGAETGRGSTAPGTEGSSGGLAGFFARPKLFLSLAMILSGVGVVAWFTMPREEDPKLLERFGLVVTPYPGADALTIERLVAEPIEDHLAEVPEVKRVESTIRAGVLITNVRLRDDVGLAELEPAWDRVEEALDDARRELPEEAHSPDLDRHLFDPEAVVVALTGSPDVLELADAAEALRRRLLSVEHVSRVEITGDPGAQITVAFDDATARRLGLDPRQLAGMLDGRNSTIPGGAIQHEGRRVEIRPSADFRTVAEIATTPVPLPSGAAIPLQTVADVRRMPREPVGERMRLDGSVAVALGVVPEPEIDVIAFGAAVRREIAAFAANHPELALHEVAFQPAKVAGRLGELGGSLLLGIGIVAGVLFLTMGARLGTVVASVVPLVTFAAVAVYAAGGGVLHQIAVAALVIALGLLVDNAIVMAELIQRRIDDGLPRAAAAASAIRELALPLGAATGTTLAAFLPMMLSEGPSADFTRAIPLVLILALVVSYGYALVVTPALSALVLRPSRKHGAATRRQATPGEAPADPEDDDPGPRGWLERLAGWIGRTSARHPWLVLGVSAGIVTGSSACALLVDFSFFPSSDREQLVVSLELPEGTHLDETDAVARWMEQELAEHPRVSSVASFVGRGVPFFYYNVLRRPDSPHLAELIVTTDGPEAVTEVQAFVRRAVPDVYPDVVAVPRRLEQGPPVPADVVVRLTGPDLDELSAAAATVRGVLRGIPGVVDLRVDEGLGAPTLDVEIDDAAAARRGLVRQDIAVSLLGRTQGLVATAYRAEDDPIPVVVRSRAGEDTPIDELDGLDVSAPGNAATPLGQVASGDVSWTPAVLHHRNRARVVSVLANTADDTTYAAVVGAFEAAMAAPDAPALPPGVHLEQGGAFESSKESNVSLADKMPYGLLLLVAILLAEFNSFRRVFIVLATAPLAVMGIWPGLAIADLPFGFVALLGALALIGIVVNGAIVLLDVTERHRRQDGLSTVDALERAVALRTRPILLTTATTIAGLLPLLFSTSTLWPPLSAAMVSGLSLGTMLTLFVVPSLYRLLFREPSPPKA